MWWQTQIKTSCLRWVAAVTHFGVLNSQGWGCPQVSSFRLCTAPPLPPSSPFPKQALQVAHTERSLQRVAKAAQCPSSVMWAHSALSFCLYGLVKVEEPCTCLGNSNALESLPRMSLECSIHIYSFSPSLLPTLQQRQHVSHHSNSTKSTRSDLLSEFI